MPAPAKPLQNVQADFRIRLGESRPADLSPLKLRLIPGKHAVRARSRKDPPAQSKFFDAYVDQLVNMGFLLPNPTASWQASPLPVAKKGKATFRMTIDHSPINAVTIKEEWPMPHIDAEVQDFRRSV